MEGATINNEMEIHWKTGFEDYEGGIYGEKVLLHAKIQEVYMSDKLAFIKGGYYVKV